VNTPESLLHEHFHLTRKLAAEAKRRFPCSDYDDNHSIAMKAMWECCQQWNGTGVFEKIVRCCFNRRLLDAYRAATGRTERQRERTGRDVPHVHLDKDIDGKPVAELVSTSPPNHRFEELVEEIRQIELKPKERIVLDMVLIQGGTAKEAAKRLRVSVSRIGQIRMRVECLLRKHLSAR